MPTVHLIIKGKVQGVFYRATAKKMAEGKGVTGWVRNTPEGHVEMIASASQETLDSFIEWCREGPCAAKVKDIKSVEKEEQNFDAFVIKR